MNAISVNGVSKSVKDEDLFSNVSFGLDIGQKMGIIGKNGAGKSTFLRLIAGELNPDSGEICINNSCRVGFLKQNVEYSKGCTLGEYLRLSDDLLIQILKKIESGDTSFTQKAQELGVWDIETRYKRHLSEMNVRLPLDTEMDSLSGGMRKKAAIARVLSLMPNILLLDEPTNHLDIPAIEYLENQLASSVCTVILVTHDRYFLDRICGRIMEIDRRKVWFYEGGYTEFLVHREERISAMQKEQDRLSNILRREIQWLRRGPKARTGKDSGRKQRIEEMKELQIRPDEDERCFSSIQRRMGKKILELKGVSVKRGDLQILNGFSLEFTKGQRIGVVGENGSGKSTLLEVMTGNLDVQSGTVDKGINTVFGYYDQMSINLPLDKTPLEFLSDISENIILSDDYSVTPARFLELFGFPQSFHRLPVSILSGGEKRRLYLLSKLVKNPNFLVLDEPTNDLDIDTLRRLEEYILDFHGCVIAVSHDRAFLDRCFPELIIMPDALRYEGTYSQWHSEVLASEKENRIKTESVQPAQRVHDRKKEGPTFREKREFEELEKTIEELEDEKKILEEFFSSGSPDSDGLKQKRYREIESTLEKDYARWETLACLM